MHGSSVFAVDSDVQLPQERFCYQYGLRNCRLYLWSVVGVVCRGDLHSLANQGSLGPLGGDSVSGFEFCHSPLVQAGFRVFFRLRTSAAERASYFPWFVFDSAKEKDVKERAGIAKSSLVIF